MNIINFFKKNNIIRKLGHYWLTNYKEGSISRVKVGIAAGMKCIRTHKYNYAFWSGHYDYEVQQIMQSCLKPGDCFYDIGANAGFFSIGASRLVGENGKVFAFEPSIKESDYIESWVQLNGIKNIEIIIAAVSNESGTSFFQLNEKCASMHHLITDSKEKYSDKQDIIEVKTITLDEFIQNHPVPNLMKIDVEGAELKVFEGAKNLLSKKPKIILEIHKGVNPEEVNNLLEANGYSIKLLKETTGRNSVIFVT